MRRVGARTLVAQVRCAPLPTLSLTVAAARALFLSSWSPQAESFPRGQAHTAIVDRKGEIYAYIVSSKQRLFNGQLANMNVPSSYEILSSLSLYNSAITCTQP